VTTLARRPEHPGSKSKQPESARRSPAKKRVRLSPGDRESMILDAAMDFFTENGFSAQTRDLAKRIGIS
jgi:AcrR family transcriptional regulator